MRYSGGGGGGSGGGLTISVLRYANVDGLIDAADGLSRVCQHLRSSGSEYFGQVVDPLRSKENWSGAGQPEASTVAFADGLAIYTAISRLTVAVNTLRLAAQVIGACRDRIDEVATRAENRRMTVHSDGTVDPVSDDGEREADAKAWTRTLQVQLARAEKFDHVCAVALRRLAGRKAGKKDGYRLPVYSAYSRPDLSQQAEAAFRQPYGKQWKPVANTHNFGVEAWQAAMPANMPCTPAGKLGAAGGGFLLGPDMRLYPIVKVPDSRETNDPTWHTVSVQVGVDDFDRTPEETRRAQEQMVTGAIVGANYGVRGFVDVPLTKEIQPQGHLPPTLPRKLSTHAVPPRRELDPRYGRLNAALVPSYVMNAAVQAQQVGNNHTFVYETIFQQNAQGELRTVIKSYQVEDGKVQPHSSYVDRDGNYVAADMEVPPSIQPRD